ncbi:MAG: CHASE2 domain-containing protein [Verrucomicrobia bacterium]|nr:CHASE2 domain-containing protein [Verrucomicrobiota bacterium]
MHSLEQDPEARRNCWLFSAVSIVAFGLAMVWFPLGEGLATWSYDVPFLFRSRVLETNVIVVIEDRASLDALGERDWPPDRRVHARLVDRLREAGAQVVVFDILFRNPRPGEDEFLAAAMRRHGRVILGGIPEISMHRVDDQIPAQLVQWMPPTPQLATNAAGWGLLLAGPLDAGFGVRRMLTAWRGHEAAIWLAARQSGLLSPGASPAAERWIDFYGPPPSIARVTLGEVLEVDGRKLTPDLLRGKTVFVGFDPAVTPASGMRDVFATPYTRVGHDFAPGVEVLANAYANLVRGDWLRRVDDPRQGLLVTGFGVGVVALFIRAGRRHVLWLTPVVFLLLGASSLMLQWHFGWWWNWLSAGLIQLPLAALAAWVWPYLPVVAFISYRRDRGSAFALAVRSELRARGYAVYLDVTSLEAGEYPVQLLRQIERVPNFILILSPGSLDERITLDSDWLRREIVHAFECKKRIIPIVIEGFEFGEAARLPVGLNTLPACQAVTHHHDQPLATFELLEKFLR